EARRRIERDRIPVVRTSSGWAYDGRILQFESGTIFNRPPFSIDTRRPIDVNIGRARDELTRLAIQDVEKPILIRLHQNATIAAIDFERRQHQWLRRVVVPVVARSCLVVPSLLAVTGVNGDYRGDVEAIPVPTETHV